MFDLFSLRLVEWSISKKCILVKNSQKEYKYGNVVRGWGEGMGKEWNMMNGSAEFLIALNIFLTYCVVH